jgi:hypothetical protein
MEFHERVEGTIFLNHGKQRDGADAKHTRVRRHRISVRRKVAENNVISVHFLRDVQHSGVAQFRGGGQPVVIHLIEAAGVGIDLLPGCRELLDGQFFQSFANPIETRACTNILKRKNQKNTFLGKGGPCGWWHSIGLSGMSLANTKQKTNTQQEAGKTAHTGQAHSHSAAIVTEQSPRISPMQLGADKR